MYDVGHRAGKNRRSDATGNEPPHAHAKPARKPKRSHGAIPLSFGQLLWKYSATYYAMALAVALFLLLMLAASSVMTSSWPAAAPRFVGGGSAPDCAIASVVRRNKALAVVPTAAILPGDQDCGIVYYAYRNREASGGSGVVEREVEGVIISGSCDLNDYPQIRLLYSQHLASLGHPYWSRAAKNIAQGDSRSTSVRTLRLFWVLALLASIGLFVRSTFRLRPIVEHVSDAVDERLLTAEERRWKSLADGDCPDCGYSLYGLSERRCPECGGTWSESEASAWRHMQNRKRSRKQVAT